MRRGIYIFGAVGFALVAVLFVVILLFGPDDRGYSKDGYGPMAIWAVLMSGLSVFLARRKPGKQ